MWKTSSHVGFSKHKGEARSIVVDSASYISSILWVGTWYFRACLASFLCPKYSYSESEWCWKWFYSGNGLFAQWKKIPQEKWIETSESRMSWLNTYNGMWSLWNFSHSSSKHGKDILYLYMWCLFLVAENWPYIVKESMLGNERPSFLRYSLGRHYLFYQSLYI